MEINDEKIVEIIPDIIKEVENWQNGKIGKHILKDRIFCFIHNLLKESEPCKKIELTIKRKGGIEKQVIPGKCVANGLIDLVAAAKEAGLEPDEFIVCYALMTAEIKKEKEILK